MNVSKALEIADIGGVEGLCGVYPTAARVLADEVRFLRNRNVLASLIVLEQAEDEGLWFESKTATEAYLQAELRRLTAAIEGNENEA